MSCPTRTTAELLHDGRDATPTPDPTRPDAGATRDHGVHAVEARHERAQADGRDRRERAVRATTDIRSEYGIFPTGSLQTKRPRRETRETESESAPLSGLMSVVVRHGRGACERERESERSSERERDQRGNRMLRVVGLRASIAPNPRAGPRFANGPSAVGRYCCGSPGIFRLRICFIIFCNFYFSGTGVDPVERCIFVRLFGL